MGRAAKLSLLAAGIGLGALIAIALIGVSYLRSDAGSSFILGRIKRTVESAPGARFEYTKGRVDPFGRVSFEGLHVIWIDGPKRLEAHVRAIDLEYSLSILKRKVEFSRFEIADPKIQWKGVPAESTGKRETGRPLDHWITDPPAQVVARQVKISGLGIQAEHGPIRVQARGIEAGFSVEWLPRRLTIGSEFGMIAPAQVWISASQSSKAPMLVVGKGKLGLAVREEAGEWRYEVSPLEFVSSAREIRLAAGSLADLHGNLKGRILAKTKKLFEASPQALERAEVEFSMDLGKFVSSGPAPAPSIASQRLTARMGIGTEGALETKLDYFAHGIAAPAKLVRPAELEAHGAIKAAKDLASADGRLETKWGGRPLASIGFKSALELGAKPGLALAAEAQLALDAGLKSWFKAGDSRAALDRLGAAYANAKVQARVDSTGEPFTTILDPRVGSDESARTATIRFDAQAAQAGVPQATAQADLKQPAGGGPVQAHFTAAVPAYRSPELKRSVALAMDSEVEWDRPIGTLKAEAHAQLDGHEVASLKSRSKFRDDTMEADATLEARAEDRLEEILGAQRWSRAYGQWLAHSELKIKRTVESLESSGTTTLTQVQTTKPGVALVVSIPEPARVEHRVQMREGKVDGEMHATAPAVAVPGFARIAATDLLAKISSPSASLVELTLALKQGELLIEQAAPKKPFRLPGLQATASASLAGGDDLELEDLDVSLGDGLLKISAEATGKLKSGDFESTGELLFETPAGFPPIAGQTVRGRAEFPWTVAVTGGRKLDFEGSLDMDELSVTSELGGVTGVSGRIPVSEKLVWDPKARTLKFARLITQNPFERVDFERVRPLIEGADQVRIERIRWEDKQYGPLSAFLSVRQNMWLAQQMDATLGSGRVYGEMFLDTHPASLQLGLLSRITELNLAEILPQRYLARAIGGDKILSGRSGIVVDLNKSTVDGRIDITRIGGSQLILLINVLDPGYQDEKLNKLRYWLGVGYPTFVGLSLREGYMDMRVDLEVEGIAISQPFYGIPISTWISPATASIVKKTKEGPFK